VAPLLAPLMPPSALLTALSSSHLVGGEQLLHLVGDRLGRLGGAGVAERGAHFVGDRRHRAGPQLVDEFEVVLCPAHVAGGAEAVDPRGVVVHGAAVGVDLGDELGDREAAGVGELAEEPLAGLFGLFDDLGDVAGVVAELAVGAGVEAALDAEHEQDQDDQPAAQGKAAPQHDLLAFWSSSRPLASSRPAYW